MKHFFRNHFRFMLLFWFNTGSIAAFAVMRTLRSLSVYRYPVMYADNSLLHIVLYLVMLIPVAACLLGTALSDKVASPKAARLIALFFGVLTALGMVTGAFANYVESITYPMRSETTDSAHYLQFDKTVEKCWIDPISAVFPAEIPAGAKDVEYSYRCRNAFTVALSYSLDAEDYSAAAQKAREAFPDAQTGDTHLAKTGILEIENAGSLQYRISVTLSEEGGRITYFVEGTAADEAQ